MTSHTAAIPMLCSDLIPLSDGSTGSFELHAYDTARLSRTGSGIIVLSETGKYRIRPDSMAMRDDLLASNLATKQEKIIREPYPGSPELELLFHCIDDSGAMRSFTLAGDMELILPSGNSTTVLRLFVAPEKLLQTTDISPDGNPDDEIVQLRNLLDAMRTQICNHIFSLPFDCNRSAFSGWNRSRTRADQHIPYHDLLFLQYSWGKGAGKLDSAFSSIKKNPTTRRLTVRVRQSVHQTTSVSASALLSIAAAPEHLRILRPDSRLRSLPLTRRINHHREGHSVLFPEFITTQRTTSCTDTAENRFVLSIIEQSLRRIIDIRDSVVTSRYPTIADSFQVIIEHLQRLRNDPFFDDLSTESHVPHYTPSLLRRWDYREFLIYAMKFWGATIPWLSIERIDSLDTWYLFELQSLFTVKSCLDTLLGHATINETTESGDHVFRHAFHDNPELTIQYPGLTMFYQKRYWGYSELESIPDISLIAHHDSGSRVLLLDAKYHKDRREQRRAILEKMHFYRDSISKENCIVSGAVALVPSSWQDAWELYPRSASNGIDNSFPTSYSNEHSPFVGFIRDPGALHSLLAAWLGHQPE